MDEGVAQLFILELNGRKVIGTVGALQFEVIQYRLEHEYTAKCSYENLNVYKACWIDIKQSDPEELKEFKRVKSKIFSKRQKRAISILRRLSIYPTNDTIKIYKCKLHFVSEF